MRWEKLKNEAKKSVEGMTITRSGADPGTTVIQQILEISQPPRYGRGKGSNQDEI